MVSNRRLGGLAAGASSSVSSRAGLRGVSPLYLLVHDNGWGLVGHCCECLLLRAAPASVSARSIQQGTLKGEVSSEMRARQLVESVEVQDYV